MKCTSSPEYFRLIFLRECFRLIPQENCQCGCKLRNEQFAGSRQTKPTESGPPTHDRWTSRIGPPLKAPHQSTPSAPIDPFETLRKSDRVPIHSHNAPRRRRRTSRCRLPFPSAPLHFPETAGGEARPDPEAKSRGKRRQSRRLEMASRTVSKDIITLRGSAAIVSEFFGTRALPSLS